jgi:hypothetical protein
MPIIKQGGAGSQICSGSEWPPVAATVFMSVYVPVVCVQEQLSNLHNLFFYRYLPKKNLPEHLAIFTMSDQQLSYLPYDQALKTVGAIQEEEHPQELNRRIFTVYDINGKEVCWFDAEETIALVAPGKANPKKTEVQPLVEKYILTHIPDWSL